MIDTFKILLGLSLFMGGVAFADQPDPHTALNPVQVQGFKLADQLAQALCFVYEFFLHE